MSLLHSYLRWLNLKRTRPYRNTPLLGNPSEIDGHAQPPRSTRPAFQRAQFGKYERRKRHLKWFLMVLMFFLFGYIVWWVVESMYALELFQPK